MTRDVIDPSHPGNFVKYFQGTTAISYGLTIEMDDRLTTQSVAFVPPSVIDRPLNLILDGYESDEPLLRKILMPVSVRADAMTWLYRMIITGLDGLA